MTERVLYEISNGDVWALTRDPRTNTPVVKHQPNISSGGQVTYTDIANSCVVAPGVQSASNW